MIEKISSTQTDAVLLCGNDAKPGFYCRNKFLLEVGGNKDILGSTLDVLDEAQFIDRVFVVAAANEVKNRFIGRRKEYVLVEPQGNLVNNITAGIEKQQQRGGEQHIVIVCSDLPFLTSQSLDWLVLNSQPNRDNNTIKIPVVPHQKVQELLPTYETYYYPMREFSFKMGNNVFIDINLLNEERIKLLVKEYRNSGSDDYVLMSTKRMSLLQRYGGAEAVYTVMINYLSKMLQIKYGIQQHVPLSGLRGKVDYQRVLSRMLGHKTEFLVAPFVDMVLDVDSAVRLGIFQRGYDRISQVVRRQSIEKFALSDSIRVEESEQLALV
jgi:GTP:adenosylcobinamide-phosphate guanylyltransferase